MLLELILLPKCLVIKMSRKKNKFVLNLLYKEPKMNQINNNNHKILVNKTPKRHLQMKMSICYVQYLNAIN